MRLWILRLVLPIPYGRYVTAATTFGLILLWVSLSGVTLVESDGFTWGIALYFCVTIAYIISIFHFIVERTEQALDDLAPHLTMDAESIASCRTGIGSKSWQWVFANLSAALLMWLLQSWLMAGGGLGMVTMITGNITQVSAATLPLLVWSVTTCAVHALVDNASLFRRLTQHIDVDVLDVRKLMPFGRMAVSSTLVVIGAMASLGIMWIGADVDPWSTILPMIPLTAALLFLFLGPLWPIHKALAQAKSAEVEAVQTEINAARSSGAGAVVLAPLLSYRRELISMHEWPIDVGTLTRFGLYFVIVPLTWIGAALIENVVDLFVT